MPVRQSREPEALSPQTMSGRRDTLTLPSLRKAADPTLAIAAYLKAQEMVFDATEGRVFRPELPQREDIKMPEACLIVRPAGGGTLLGRDYLPAIDSRIDVVCYGSSRLEAENVAREVATSLKELTHSTWEKVILFWARIAGMPASAIDPETNWSFSLVAAQVMHSTRVVS